MLTGTLQCQWIPSNGQLLICFVEKSTPHTAMPKFCDFLEMTENMLINQTESTHFLFENVICTATSCLYFSNLWVNRKSSCWLR